MIHAKCVGGCVVTWCDTIPSGIMWMTSDRDEAIRAMAGFIDGLRLYKYVP